MNINLPTLAPIVQAYAYARLLRGDPAAVGLTTFVSTDVLTATVSEGQSLPSLFAPACQWTSVANAQFSLQISPQQSATLSPDVLYLLEVFVSRGGVSYPVVAAYLPVLPSAGAQGPASPPDLATVPYAGRLLGALDLTPAQLEMVPTFLASASAAIRSYCNRLFTAGTYIEILNVELDGSVRLAQIPVNRVMRIQADPAVAIAITNATADSSWVSQNSTGDQYAGLTITGLTLNWESGGVTSSANVDYAANMTIAQLATAINAVGSGWSATADDTLGKLPVTELYDTGTAQGAGPGDQPDDGVQFHVFGSNVNTAYPHPDDGALTGIYYVGRRSYRGPAPYDGAGWAGWGGLGGGFGAGSYGGTSIVRVTYSGGFVSIPNEIQMCCVELVKYQLSRLSTDLLVNAERGGEYSFDISPKEIQSLPRWCLEALCRYRVHNG